MHFVSVWIPHWIVGTVVMVVPGHDRAFPLSLVRRPARRAFVARFSPFLQQLLLRGRGPVGALVVLIVFGIALPAAAFPAPLTLGIGHALIFVTILAVGWWAARAIDLGAEFYLRRFRTDTPDNLLARKHPTQVNILRRAI
jgi:hypothetical protein